jgi:tetratricopeptide (TPR) repeat protein
MALSTAHNEGDQVASIAEIAVCHTHLEDFEEAELWHIAHITLAESEEETRVAVVNFAALQLAMGRYEAVLALLRRLDREADDGDSYMSATIDTVRAEALLGQGNSAEAVLHLRRAVNTDPSIERFEQLADVPLCEIGDFSHAGPAYSAALRSGALGRQILHRALVASLAGQSEDLFRITKESFTRLGLQDEEFNNALASAFVDAAAISRYHGKPTDELEEGIPEEYIERAEKWWIVERRQQTMQCDRHYCSQSRLR